MAKVVDRALRLLDAALAAVPAAQPREGQQAMTAAVDQALRGREHLLVQAGTGTGKSLAYLVPALASGRRVVVATATKALQAQLVDKDLPRLVAALARPLGRTPSYALAKGRGNYVCLQQLHGGPGARESDGQEELFEGEAAGAVSSLGRQVVRLRAWAQDTDTGDRDEVPFPVGDRAWRAVSVSARECLGAQCPDRVDCFSERARAAARDADVVVANHALLALHAFSGMPVLPEHDAVVLDEAHEFVSSATDALSRELSGPQVHRASTAARALLGEQARARLEDAQTGLEQVLALLPAGWVRELPAEVGGALALVEAAASAAAQELGRESGEDELAQATRERARAGLTAVAEAAGELRAPGVPSAVSLSPGPPAVLRVAPLQVGAEVAGRLFGDVTVVATSATLTVGGSFDHLARELGLLAPGGADDPPPPRWRQLDVGSPFDYARQGQLWVAADLPDPAREQAAWAAAVDALLLELVQAAGGRTLALFSSTAAAARAAAAVRAASDLPVLLQGEDSPGALQHAFAADARTCLFGTRSFWQGVDTPGSACQLVVIDRIPFGHVEDPLLRARLAAAGPRGFADVTLPPAAVLLAQGAGRLVRSAHDRGVVAVLDPRLARSAYAETLVATLPAFYRARDKEAVLASLRAIDASAPPPRPVGPPPAEARRIARGG